MVNKRHSLGAGSHSLFSYFFFNAGLATTDCKMLIMCFSNECRVSARIQELLPPRHLLKYKAEMLDGLCLLKALWGILGACDEITVGSRMSGMIQNPPIRAGCLYHNGFTQRSYPVDPWATWGFEVLTPTQSKICVQLLILQKLSHPLVYAGDWFQDLHGYQNP